jgi:hypothetical protein
MRKQATDDYIQRRTNIRYLLDTTAGTLLHGDARVVGNIVLTLELLESLDLTVSRRLAFRVGLEALQGELEATPLDASLDASQAARLKVMASQLRETTLAEAGGIFAYVTREKRLDVDRLLEDPGRLFPSGVFTELSETARLDVAEGFRCLAFELPTAAAFHLMRAVEESLRRFYLAVVKRGRVKPLLWKPMLDQLSKRRTPPPAALIAQLDHIRSSFRNPTQHPDAVYDIDGAEDLAFLSIDVLARLVRAMPSK